MSSTTTRSSGPETVKSPDQIRNDFANITKEAAANRLTALPLQMSEEAHYGLQRFKEIVKQHDLSVEEVMSVIEPLAKAVGWAEGLVYSDDKRSKESAIDQLAQTVFNRPNGGSNNR